MTLILSIALVLFILLYIKSNSELNSLEKTIISLQQEIKFLRSTPLDVSIENSPTIKTQTLKKKSNHLKKSITKDELIHFMGKKINKEYLIPRTDLKATPHYFCGKKIVITGDFDNFKDRNEMAKLLWEVGADVDTAAGKHTEIIIIGDNAGPSKIKFAAENDIELIDESAFLDLFPNYLPEI